MEASWKCHGGVIGSDRHAPPSELAVAGLGSWARHVGTWRACVGVRACVRAKVGTWRARVGVRAFVRKACRVLFVASGSSNSSVTTVAAAATTATTTGTALLLRDC